MFKTRYDLKYRDISVYETLDCLSGNLGGGCYAGSSNLLDMESDNLPIFGKEEIVSLVHQNGIVLNDDVNIGL